MRLVSEPEPCVEVSPTISSQNLFTSHTNTGSFPTIEVTFHVPRASFCSRGSDRHGLRLRPPPMANCTRPLWPLPRVVSPSEGGPTFPFRVCLGSIGDNPATRHSPASPTSRPGFRVGPR
ncbi:hypothetical protein CHARACLAT_016903 [Characodon lateralis]|uniref:Uncharacterized protein n=1 Tax=Characodon lateralis TaxID=208331 RepID=A0ABU7ELE9_9TELE|nr:hypothetical protein [Characodon lateralis]